MMVMELVGKKFIVSLTGLKYEIFRWFDDPKVVICNLGETPNVDEHGKVNFGTHPFHSVKMLFEDGDWIELKN